ncbi:MAG: glycoside hydrolase family 3 protein [Chloroflexota bacterium]
MNTERTTDLLGQRLMLAFDGTEPPPHVLEWLARRQAAGFTLFRKLNVRNPAQVRDLTAALQQAAARSGQPPLLIAADQEGGQLLALGDETTPFPGNMALGATRDAALAKRVGRALGRELAAMGVNVNYAPVCDVNSNPRNPNVGARAFGDDPDLVAKMGAALIAGLQQAGVAATAKHFPGNGDSDVDPHDGVPVLPQSRSQLEDGPFRPFRAAIAAGVRLMMSAHVALPALTGRPDLPATVQRPLMHDLLRREMGFDGVLISDAMDMGAISQGAGQIVDAIAALRAGVDVLLLAGETEIQERLYQGLQLALSRGLLDGDALKTSVDRVLALKAWLGTHEQPPLSVVGCDEHRRLARKVARRSITLLRDDGLLPLRPASDARLALVMPRPADLTPADTSSYVRPALSAALRAYHPQVEEFIVDQTPSGADVAALKQQLASYDLLLLVTLSASLQPAQAVMARELLSLGLPTVTVAARTPYDLAAYPQARTHLCTYSIQPPSMEALAAALFGHIPCRGRLPVSIPALEEEGTQMNTENTD